MQGAGLRSDRSPCLPSRRGHPREVAQWCSPARAAAQGISHAPQNKRRSVLMSECLLFFSKNLLGMAPLLSTCIQGGTAVRHILFHLMFFVQCIPHFGGCNPHTRAILGLLHHIFLFPLTSPFRPRIHPGLFLFPPHPRWSNLAPDKSAQ